MRNELHGTWHNQWGSEIYIESTDEGRVLGRMVTAVGKPNAEIFALLGFVRGDLVAFAVDFGKHGALTSWVGHLVHGDSGVVIDTLWHMTVMTPHPDRPDERWRSVYSGADRFMRERAHEPRPVTLRTPPQPLGLL